tara:strand:- start:10118 stop:11005 length:888 start_codon:yes stop_codon:yes gene_type:complete
VLLAVNLGFVIYWLIQFKRQFLLSALLISFSFFNGKTLYRFGEEVLPSEVNKIENQLNVLSYNVRVFRSETYDAVALTNGITQLVADAKPDVICFQEFSSHNAPDFKELPHKYLGSKAKKVNYGPAIFSKYKIINSGSLDFKSTFNNGIFVDIVKNADTLRVYNLHMQSLALTPKLDALEEENTKSLVGRLGLAFKKQQEQTGLFLRHQAECTYKKIVTGDFNNTVYSYTYNKIRGDKKDAFEEKGTGFGRTFIFDIIPMRIDFILADSEVQVRAFRNFDIDYSDHYPIQAVLNF